MLEDISSPDLLQGFWKAFEEGYIKQSKHRPSKRQMCAQLGLNEHSFSKWMTKGEKSSRRIPVEHIECVAVAMLLTPKERALLMTVRLREIAQEDSSMNALLTWVAETVAENVEESVTRRYALDQDEALVLQTFRKSREHFPRGFYYDSDEKELLRQSFLSLLKVAEENHIAEARSEDAQDTPEAREDLIKKVKRAQNGLMLALQSSKKAREGSNGMNPSPFREGMLRAQAMLLKTPASVKPL